MKSIFHQQQNQQYLSTRIATKEDNFSNATITDTVSKNNIDNIVSTTTTNPINTTSTLIAESFHSQNFINNTNTIKATKPKMKTKPAMLLQQQQQQQQSNEYDHDNSLSSNEINKNKIDTQYSDVSYKYNDNTSDDDNDVDDDIDVSNITNKLHRASIQNKTETEYNTSKSTLNRNDDDDDDEKQKRIEKSFSSTNSRLKFRKSHTCGSLFANCNCDSELFPFESRHITKASVCWPQKESDCNYSLEQEEPKIVKTSSLNRIDTFTANALEVLKIVKKSSDSCIPIHNIKSTPTSSTTSEYRIQNRSKNSPNTQTNNHSTDDHSNTASKLLSNDHNYSSDQKNALSDGCLTSNKKNNSQQQHQSRETLNCCKQKNRKIFESYSHPDTNFIFTDENCNPNSSPLLIRPKSIATKNGNICVRHPKRSSSPNIGNFTILDVHPEILVKVYKSDPNLKKNSIKPLERSLSSSSTTSSTSTSISVSSVRRNSKANGDKKSFATSLQQSNVEPEEICRLIPDDLVESDFSKEIRFSEYNNQTEAGVVQLQQFDFNFLPKRSLPDWANNRSHLESPGGGHSTGHGHIAAHSKCAVRKSCEQQLLLLCNKSKKAGTKKNCDSKLRPAKLESAHKYFQESGILGPNIKAERVTKLLRKTSRIIQDTNFVEHVRKNSKYIVFNSSVARKTSSHKSGAIKANDQIENNKSSVLKPSTQLPVDKSKVEMDRQTNAETRDCLTNMSASHDAQNAMSHTNETAAASNTLKSSNSCDCDSRIQLLVEEIGTLKEMIGRRDNEIHKLKREIHKLKSVLQQTNANRIILNEKNIFKHKDHLSASIHGQQQSQALTSSSSISSSSSSSLTSASATSSYSNDNHNRLLETAHSECPEKDTNHQMQKGAYNYVGLVGGTKNNNNNNNKIDNSINSCNNNAEKKLLKVRSEDQDMLRDVNKFGSKLGCASCSSKRSQSQPIVPPLVVKKQGVSGESSDAAINQSQNIPIPKYEKDFRSKQLIKEAIMDNDFLKNIDSLQIRELVESMYNLDVAEGEFVIREGEVGSHLYVSAEGDFEVIKNDYVLGTMGPGKAFGELAILYNCTRTASIRVLSQGARVWVLDRRVFQQIMMRTGMQKIEENIRFLQSVPLFKNLSNELFAKIADVLEVEFYPAGTYIIRQGASGDTFFLISQGTVKVTQKLGNLQEEKEIRTLQRGDYFGEQALINVDKRTASIIAMTPGVECLTLDRESFNHLIGDLCELKEKNYGDENRILAMKYSEQKEIKIFGADVKQEFPDLKLTDLEVVATLGIGGFGRVELVRCHHRAENRMATYALKCLKKKHIINTRQEEHVFSERTIMLTCKSPFICRLHKTFRDTKYIYMLLESCMGGEVWTMLRDRGSFNEIQTQFITGCVIQAFEYLHSRNIIYRDLKPENLMLSEQGYVKLVDFGFAKYIGNSQKTWTFCGTPEYVAPEIILNKGHDRAVDYWALGILIHELLNGTPPFTANDPMKTYNIILKGIDMIDFPNHMSRSAVMLIKKLCRDVPAERLGYSKGGIDDIRKHKWFQGFDWDCLANLTLTPPFLRPVSNPLDTSYFDKFPADTDIPPDETSGWDSDF